MRVLFLNGRLAERGGADRWLLGVVARLQAHATTHIVVANRDPTLPDHELQRVGSWSRVKGLDRRGLERHARAPLGALAAEVAAFAPDVIHANDVVDPEVLEWLAADGRAVLMIQDHRSFCPGRGKVDLEDQPCTDPIGQSCLRCFEDHDLGQRRIDLTQRRLAAVRRATTVTVLSRYMRDELVAGGVAPERVHVVPPFVDRLHLEGDPVAATHHLFAGRLALHKGVATALTAAALLQHPLPLVVAGDGPLAREVEAVAKRHPDRVRYVGWATRDGFAELLRGACCLWMPSLWAEPFGIVGLEALAAGVPVLASDGGGVRDWLRDGVDGRCLPPRSAEDWAAAADEMARDAGLAQRMGAAGRRRVRTEFPPERCVDTLVQLYEQVAAGTTRR